MLIQVLLSFVDGIRKGKLNENFSGNGRWSNCGSGFDGNSYFNGDCFLFGMETWILYCLRVLVNPRIYFFMVFDCTLFRNVGNREEKE